MLKTPVVTSFALASIFACLGRSCHTWRFLVLPLKPDLTALAPVLATAARLHVGLCMHISASLKGRFYGHGYNKVCAYAFVCEYTCVRACV